MKGDFSRDTFNPRKHFSRVLQQQGRVQLDADTNEQTAILLYYLRTLAADLIGPYARPAGSDGGFKITKCDDGNFSISAGRFYVDGILCENEKPTDYKGQLDYPNPPDIPTTGKFLAYLDVWERHITALEDPDIREKALGGPDTATRNKVVWQVKVDAGDDSCLIPESCEEILKADKWDKWVSRWQPENRGLLRARVQPSEDSTNPCLTAPDAKYRSQENQLYRIEIHQGSKANNVGNGTACATFKWSRDNGAVVSRVVEFSGTKLVVEKPHGFEAGIWVELINNDQELRGEPGNLVKLIKVEGNCFTIESPVSEPCAEVKHQPDKVRRWDQCGNGSLKLDDDGAVPVVETETRWIEIENGIEIQFVLASDAHCYRTGDYWLIPARVATGGIEWPESDEKGIPPFGIEHHYAPLAIFCEEDYKNFECRFKLWHECE